MTQLTMPLLLLSLVYVTPCIGQSAVTANPMQGVVLSDVPDKIDRTAQYLFYLHGRIIEDRGRRPTHEQHGVYEYDRILEVFRNGGVTVISEARKKDTDVEQYAALVTAQVRKLIKGGVPPRNITVVGASKGAFIAMLTSTYLKNRNVTFVIIAGCGADDQFLDMVDLHGRVLSVFERSDSAGSCHRFRADATGLSEFREVELNTGLAHGFLYRPMKEWVEPVMAWSRRWN